MLDESTVDAYLERIGAERPRRPDLDALRRLHERHVLTVPFENLDYHQGLPVHLDESLVDKIVRRRRGGGCYELNPAFGFLLEALGYRVSVHPGRTFSGDELGPPMCHLALKVELEQDWLVDVGFGWSSRGPLALAEEGEQYDPHGTYVLKRAADGTDVHRDGRPQYRIDHRSAALGDFQPTLWWYRTAPDSPFLQYVFCAKATEDGRVTIKDRKVSVTRAGQRESEEVTDDAVLLAAYKEHFGIELDEAPRRLDVYEGKEVDMYID